MKQRKIIHIDMDAFYASVELREAPHLCGLPVVVAWEGKRSVICAASYEARRFGLRSAMSAATAKRLCPQAVFIPPRFPLYREISAQIHNIFRRHTDLIEPVSLDEAYLDVTDNKQNRPYAQDIAAAIRADIFAETALTASAGIAPNKFLAKIASDWNKPNGQFVIPPHKIARFMQTLPLEKIPGVGRKTLSKLHAFGWHTAADLQTVPPARLAMLFGRWGYRLHELAHGTDERPVEARRERVQISTEITLPEDLPLSLALRHLPGLARDLSAQTAQKNLCGHTLTLKLKTETFRTLTRSRTYSSPLYRPEQLAEAAALLAAQMPDDCGYRLIGIGLHRLTPRGCQTALWPESAG